MPISPLDDYPVHQVPLPVAHMASSDPNHYDRYWFNGYDIDGEWYIGVAMGVYPNRGIIDAAFSVLRDGQQSSVFASGRLPLDRRETKIGPISLELIEPLRENRLRVEAEHLGITADLLWQPRTIAHEEARQTLVRGNHTFLDSTRFTQWGAWSGTVRVNGVPLEITTDRCRGTKDRSWGARPVGDQVSTAPVQVAPGIAFFWSPVHWEDRCTHAMLFEKPDGSRYVASAASIPVLKPGEPTFGNEESVEHAYEPMYKIRWRSGTRRMEEASFIFNYPDGRSEEFTYEPLLDFQMKGIGYTHPHWSHGKWHGEYAEGAESWNSNELNLLDITNFHCQQVCRVRNGKQAGIGVLEQLVIGPHVPTGLTDFMGGAP
ncbi:MAG: hypothetical protein WD826_06450 [Actinomycetota bacterium]